jgi:DNA mismatch repair protein MutS2
LVLLDELAVGTDPIQGSALAQAVLEHFADLNTISIVTTHYENLKILPMQDQRFRNAAVEYDQKEGIPTYQLRYDVPGSSSALSTARRLGLPEALIDRAIALSGSQHGMLEEIIKKLDAEVKLAQKAKNDAEIETRKLQNAKLQVEKTQEKLNERLKKGLDKERNDALTEIRKLREYIKSSRQKLDQSQLSENDLRDLEKNLTLRTDQINQAIIDSKSDLYGPPLDPSVLKIGMKVWVLTLDTTAELVSLPNDKNKCSVKAGLLSAIVDLSSLRQAVVPVAKKSSVVTPQPSITPSTPPKKKEVSWEIASPQHHGNTVDVRGMRGDDAILEVERSLEELYAHGENIIFVIHGHGTGILKKHLREWLPAHKYIKAIRPGQPHEGGDGVTAALLG